MACGFLLNGTICESEALIQVINVLICTRLKTVIWNNSNIKCDNKILFYRKWFASYGRASYGVYISQLIRFARVCNHVTDFNARNKCLTAKLLQQGYRYHKLRKTFSKFYRRHYELISKYNVGLKTLLSEGLSEPEFYGDLVYKLKKLKGINDFSLQFGKIISRYRRIGYNLNVMRQSACLVFNPIMVDNYAAFFNCTPVGRASDSMMAPT